MSLRFRPLVVAFATLLISLTPPPPSVRSSTIAASVAHVIAVNPDSRSVTILDARTNGVLGEVAIGGTPQTVTIPLNSDRAYVATREGALVAIDPAARKILWTIQVDRQLYGVAAANGVVYVTAPASGRVYVIDPVAVKVLRTIETEAYPRGIVATYADVFVTHLRSGKMSILDANTGQVKRVVVMSDDGNLSQGIFATWNRVYLPQTRSNSSNPALQFDTTVLPVVAIFDVTNGEALDRLRYAVDIIDRPVNVPLDCVLAGNKLYVANGGSDDVSVIETEQRKSLAHFAVGKNPTGLALSTSGLTLYVNDALSGTISVIDLATDRVTAAVKSTTIPLAPHLLKGKILFHSASSSTLTKENWVSCASCHFEGGTDGRTWLFRDGPRNTPALYGVHETLPIHWSGDLKQLEDVGETVRVVQAGSGLSPNDLGDLVAYLRSLQPPSTPPPTDYESVLRGRDLFFDPRTACSSCHAPPLYTDRLTHDVGTASGAGERKGSAIDTPSLRGLFDTAPYLHDGSAPTLQDVLRRHGNTSGLTQQDLDDLTEFLKSLPFPQARRRSL